MQIKCKNAACIHEESKHLRERINFSKKNIRLPFELMSEGDKVSVNGKHKQMELV